MREQEAKLLSSRLWRVWGPKNVLRSESLGSGQEGFTFWAELTIASLNIQLTQDESGFSCVLYGKDDFRSGCQGQLVCVGGDVFDHISPDDTDEIRAEQAKFAANWTTFFRRSCWLSGFPIEASADEKEEWMREFDWEELESWGLKDINERVQWKATQVAAAFEVNQWKQRYWHHGDWMFTSFGTGDDYVQCQMMLSGELMFVTCGSVAWCRMDFYYHLFTPVDATHSSSKKPHHLMARGLYRLGVTNEDILCQLPPLTTNEKLELRLSMPREFWPQYWLDEEAQ